MCSYIVLIVFSYFPIVSLRSLSIFKTVDLSSLTSNSYLWASLEIISVKIFFSCEWTICVCVCLMFSNFLLRTTHFEYCNVVVKSNSPAFERLLIFAWWGLQQSMQCLCQTIFEKSVFLLICVHTGKTKQNKDVCVFKSSNNCCQGSCCSLRRPK